MVLMMGDLTDAKETQILMNERRQAARKERECRLE